jgi:hypothetical protein
MGFYIFLFLGLIYLGYLKLLDRFDSSMELLGFLGRLTLGCAMIGILTYAIGSDIIRDIL